MTQSPGPEQLQLLCDIARAAGREIMAVYATDFECRIKDDASPVTDADLRAEAVIRAGLQAAFPDLAIVSEESPIDAAAAHSAFFLVDPLDGTREFITRNDEFTVNIALIQSGEPVAGVVFAPALDELFYAARGFGSHAVTRQGEQSLRTVAAPAAPLRVIASRSHGAEALASWLHRLGPHALVSAGSSLKFCRIAQGRADLYPRLGPTSQWDTAAAQAILEEAGGQVLDRAGRPLRYGLSRPMVNPNFVAIAVPGMAYPLLP